MLVLELGSGLVKVEESNEIPSPQGRGLCAVRSLSVASWLFTILSPFKSSCHARASVNLRDKNKFIMRQGLYVISHKIRHDYFT